MITSATGFGNRKAGRRHRVGGGGGAVSGERNSGDGEVGDAGRGHGRRPGEPVLGSGWRLGLVFAKLSTIFFIWPSYEGGGIILS